MEIKVIFLPLMAVWGLALLFLLFRGGLESVWKGAGVILFIFYAIWFHREIAGSYRLYLQNLSAVMPIFFITIGDLIAVSLVLAWPVGISIAFFTKSSEFSRGIMKSLLFITLFFWIFRFQAFFTPPYVKDGINLIAGKLEPFLKVIANPPER